MLKAPSSDKIPTARSPSKVQFSISPAPTSPIKPSFQCVKSLEHSIHTLLDSPISPISRASPFRQVTYWADLGIISSTCALVGFRSAALWLAWGVPFAHLSLSFEEQTSSERREYHVRRIWMPLVWLALHSLIHLALALADRSLSHQFSFDTMSRDAFLMIVLACAVATRLVYYYQTLQTLPIPVPPPSEKAKRTNKLKEAKAARRINNEEDKRWEHARRRTIQGYESRPSLEPVQNNLRNTSVLPTLPQPPVWKLIMQLLGMDLIGDSWNANGDGQADTHSHPAM
ncbi:hypothetical protein DACRYDRAFT_102965 [Dacryopinax primogenitus]|uniref:Uncharacterized protein n=1 Tax=Dacryopinax primogenitus (strain DJM 731) TaxID=1858805 RepID=M5GGS7_DACPD|nr:uncharacterized protein DACRYDRAFT_102965 [Dacryopinax primogenitus]EJU06008.1 hypothetical protein DACRYDRAFT_102965 [Dacryopinax primogenitus]